MVKRILLSACIMLIALNIINAQCTPNASYGSLIYPPDSLPHATATVTYSSTIYCRIPTDTVLGTLTATIDSVKVTNIKGLPSGFSYACNKQHWIGGEHGCVEISGTTNDVSLYTLKFFLMFYGKIFGNPASAPDSSMTRKLRVIAYNNVPTKNYEIFEVFQNKPNPFSEYTEIKFTSPLVQNIDFAVINILGQTIYSEKIKAKIGENRIIFSSINVSPGIYFYKISNGNAVFIKKMTVN
ncbi:MAG: T9SS type A sorting domain-containing protein [Bacteroidales bacterium]|nr:T9SS type A sorting domain-containing protein [Bacteroidales bacterium]